MGLFSKGAGGRLGRLLGLPRRVIGVARLIRYNLTEPPSYLPPEDDGGPRRRR